MNRWQRDQARRAIHAALAAHSKRIAAGEARFTAVDRGLRAIWGAITKIETRQTDLDHRLTAPERKVTHARDLRRVPAVTAALRLGVGPATIRRRIADGTLDGLAIRSGGRRRWTVTLASLEALERGAPGAPGAENRAAAGRRAPDTKG